MANSYLFIHPELRGRIFPWEKHSHQTREGNDDFINFAEACVIWKRKVDIGRRLNKREYLDSTAGKKD